MLQRRQKRKAEKKPQRHGRSSGKQLLTSLKPFREKRKLIETRFDESSKRQNATRAVRARGPPDSVNTTFELRSDGRPPRGNGTRIVNFSKKKRKLQRRKLVRFHDEPAERRRSTVRKTNEKRHAYSTLLTASQRKKYRFSSIGKNVPAPEDPQRGDRRRRYNSVESKTKRHALPSAESTGQGKTTVRLIYGERFISRHVVLRRVHERKTIIYRSRGRDDTFSGRTGGKTLFRTPRIVFQQKSERCTGKQFVYFRSSGMRVRALPGDRSEVLFVFSRPNFFDFNPENVYVSDTA